jgi:HlyD family secretion protein
VPRIPNAALRYKPSPPGRADGKPVVPAARGPARQGDGRVYVLTSDKPGDEKDESGSSRSGSPTASIPRSGTARSPPGTKVVTDETDSEERRKRRGSDVAVAERLRRRPLASSS